MAPLAVIERLQRLSDSIPLVVVVDPADEAMAVECLQKGAADYILRDRMARLPFAVRRALGAGIAAKGCEWDRGGEFLSAILRTLGDAVLGVSPEGIVTSWNDAAERIYGYAAEEMIGRSILLTVPPELVPHLEGILAALRRGEPVEPYETVRIRKDGSRIDLLNF